MAFQRRILICGGCGFMGSHFIRRLYHNYPNYQIVNFDLLTYAGNPDNLIDIEKLEESAPKDKKRYIFIKADICDKKAVNEAFENYKFDVVVNFAAESHVDRSILSAAQFINTNVYGAFVLLEAARIHKTPRFVYISTDEVYGDILEGVESSEDYPLRPTNPYAASKASADLLAQAYGKTHKMPIVIVRSSNNYGSHQYPEKLHPLVITNLLEDRPIPLHGDGKHLRSWVHVDDFCSAVDLVMHKGDENSIYNIAGEERSNLEVIQTIAQILNKDFKKCVNYVNDRPGPDFRYAPNSTKITKELGWTRQRSYEKAVEDLIKWYIGNQDWWMKVRSKPDFISQYFVQSKGYDSFEDSCGKPGKF